MIFVDRGDHWFLKSEIGGGVAVKEGREEGEGKKERRPISQKNW